MKPSRVRAALAVLFAKASPPANLSNVDDSRGWFHLWGSGRGDGDLNTGDWQKDLKPGTDTVLSFFAVFACQTQIAGDIAKLALRLMEKSASGIWEEAESPAYSPVLRKPNHFQTRQQFIECWMLSKMSRGNTYVLKERDARRVVVRQYVLDPDRVTPLVAPDGSVFYELRQDDLSHVPTDRVAVPASEVIHDRMNCLFHPLVGISPLWACSLAAGQGLAIQKNSARFFANMSRPSGILTAPAKISDETAARLKTDWENNFAGGKIGKVAVLGDSLNYVPMATTPKDSTLVEQLELSAEQVCAAHGVPPFMVSIGAAPSYDNVQALTQWYYSQTLQKLIEAIESLEDEGLSLDPAKYRTEFDLDGLIRMDSKTLAEVETAKVKGAISSPNEARRKFNMPPVSGGESPMLQQQNYSLAALAKRDRREDPFGTASAPPPAPAPAPAPPPEDDDEATEDQKQLASIITREFDELLER